MEINSNKLYKKMCCRTMGISVTMTMNVKVVHFHMHRSMDAFNVCIFLCSDSLLLFDHFIFFYSLFCHQHLLIVFYRKNFFLKLQENYICVASNLAEVNIMTSFILILLLTTKKEQEKRNKTKKTVKCFL